jgi:hypothetical protein
MRQERLSGITLLNIEKDFEINLGQIVTDFTAKEDVRKMIFEAKSFHNNKILQFIAIPLFMTLARH